MAAKLAAGDLFPEVSLRLLDGDEVTLPGDMASPYGVVLFYRGHW